MRWLRIERLGPYLAALAFLISFIILVGGVTYTFAQQRENEKRIAENAQTAFALCNAAAGARDFWIGVRRSTLDLLEDPTLSPIARKSNEDFVKALNRVIAAADDLAGSCSADPR